MNRRTFLGGSLVWPLFESRSTARWPAAQEPSIESGAPSPNPISEPHFPDRVHLFVWRNWELANTDRMAKVLGTSPENVLEIGESLGLPAKPQLTSDQLRRIYITVIRQNWHVLPDEQLIELLGWDRQHYEYTLKEDDFLWIKLGLLKPRCEPLRFESPSAQARERAAEIKRYLRQTMGGALAEPGEPAFRFVADLESAQEGQGPTPDGSKQTARLEPRYAYSYFALYGDPLMAEGIDPFPAGFLEKLARAGVDGVWLQAVLRNLAPSTVFSEFGTGAETRLQHLRALVERADAYGVKVYLYLNEPRSMPAAFFARYPQIKGTHDARDPQFSAMCTSTPEVREWMRESLAHVFAEVPKLGGVFAITASENLTNCYSHENAQACPRCSLRKGDEVIAEVIQTFRDGVREQSKAARVIAWDWGWGDEGSNSLTPSEGIIARLPADVDLLSVSEWDMPIDRGGVKTQVGEYSISVVGPGPRALKNWELARRRGLRTLAKVQWNNTWELSAVPYIPVPNLIAQHCENLRQAQIQGLMVSWTLGGYPSPNFEVAKHYYFAPAPERDEALRSVAVQRYGKEAAPQVLQAWEIFSRAFQEFPMEGGGVVYFLPMQHGPSNLLRLHPTGYKATMSLFPYDDYRSWAGSYPPQVEESQLQKMATEWQAGLEHFRKALARVPAAQQDTARKDLGIAETCYFHAQSAANQIRFFRLRDQLDSAPGGKRQEITSEMSQIAQQELEITKRQFVIARQDSRIAFEATNHYFYRPLDLLEKILNCQDLIRRLRSPGEV